MTLPQWIIESIPAIEQPNIIGYNEETEKYIVSEPHNNVTFEYDSLAEAYDNIENDINRTNVIFADNVPEKIEKGRFITVPSSKNTHRWLTENNDIDRYSLIVDDFKNFIITADKYRDDPQDFMKSYIYVTNHPAFWIKTNAEKSFYWSTVNSPFFLAPGENDDGIIYWMMEFGAHVEPDYTTHYHDLRLDVFGLSVEECYINLAEKVNKFFYDDGTEKENVEYEKSEFELQLEEAIRKLDENEAENDEDA